jgi:beta-galactosidase/beta-glucuronidase
MKDKKIVEIAELDVQKRWEYLTRYYNIAAEFFGATDQVLSEEEIDNCVKSFKEKPMPVFRKQLHLKKWKFKLDEKREGARNEYFSGSQDESGWEDVSIPHAIMHVPDDPVRYGRTEYCALVTEKGEYCDIWRGDYDTWYKNRLSNMHISDDEVVFLGFASANLISTVWVNERPVMLDHLGLFPFKMDVTEEMKAGNGKGIIAVKVSNIASTVPEMFYNGIQYAYSQRPYTNGRTELDWIDQVWTGLSGDVTLSVMNKTHIDDIFVYTDNIQGSSANQVFEIKLKNTQWKRFNGRIRLDISRWLPCEGKIEKSLEQDVTILPMNDAEVKIRLNFDSAFLWDVDTPNLYLVHAVLLNNEGKEVDDLFESFGIRTIKMSGNSFLLNNKKMVPRGTHDVCNYHGEPIICPSDRIIVKDILLHKKMGSNCSRWPSDIRMHYKKIAEYCDQLGFMLSWTGYFEIWTINP